MGSLWNAEVCFQPPSLPIGKVLALVMTFCVWHTPYRVLWRGGRRVELFRSILVLLLTGPTIGGILFRLCSVGVGGTVLSVLTVSL